MTQYAARRRHIRNWMFVAITCLLTFSIYYGWQILVMGAAYKAKLLCSKTFIAKRAPKDILRDDLNGPERFISSAINHTQKYVTAGLPGIPEQKAIFVPHLGCILLAGSKETDVRRRTAIKTAPTTLNLETSHSNAELIPVSYKPGGESWNDRDQVSFTM